MQAVACTDSRMLFWLEFAFLFCVFIFARVEPMCIFGPLLYFWLEFAVQEETLEGAIEWDGAPNQQRALSLEEFKPECMLNLC